MNTTFRFLLMILLGLALTAGYFLATSNGSWAVCRWAFSKATGSKNISVNRVEGSILSGLGLQVLRVTDLPRVPPGSDLEIRMIRICLPLFRWHRPDVTVRNARLQLTDSEPVLISGLYRRGVMRLNVYSRRVDAQQVLLCFMNEEDSRKFSGPAGPLDLNLYGKPRHFEVTGDFRIPQLNYYGFSLTDATGTVALKVRPGSKEDGLKGEVVIQSGTLILKNSIVKLEPSRISYAGDLKRPVFDLYGTALIERVPIHITLKGTFHQPELTLSSDPPLPQPQLLLMLATGRRWKSMEGVSREGELPLDLVNDFIDFAAFGGSGSRIAERFGVEGALLVGEGGKSAGVGIRTSLSDRVGVRYGVEQSQGDLGQSPSTRQKLGADLDVTETDQVSVEAESEVSTTGDPQSNPSKTNEATRTGRVLLKYKKKF